VQGRPRLYVEGIDPAAAAGYADVVDSPAEADLAVLRVDAPFEPREGFLESLFHQGSLDFPPEVLLRVLEVARQVPTVVDVFLDRPAILTGIADAAAALVGSFGSSDQALLDLVFGHVAPTARLPFELPSSMDAVLRQLPDVPYDSEEPLFPFGHGLSY
jgi:beta-glucosidase